ncbi:Flp family type IVb pilin [Desulfotruncus alcoholivorax]|uniref:Flp family type IVb pilin n=1 Tax=Desulfotruncus alcoholivorax TaxID=265477 RepID=UPI00040917E2|nr:Flp family type IVb pilin [Desulfotruncus alcoholivorax]
MLLSKLLREESGQGMAEYGLILALVAVLCIAGFKLLGDGISGKVDDVQKAIKDPSSVNTSN